jgi:DNA polymerase/3'-5' exonuclease PolX
MSSGEPRPHRDMLRLAVEAVKLLAPYCTRIAIAGSIRRGKAMVGDIEIVCQPAEMALPSGKKGFIHIKQDGVKWICDRLREDGVFEPRLNMSGNPEAWSDRHKRAFYQGAKLDLFIVQPDRSWGYTMLLRTGPGDANGVLVTKLGVRNHDGNLGILPAAYQFREGELWRNELHIPTPEEKDVFAALDLPYMPPPLRSVEMYQRWAARRPLRSLPTPFAESPRLMMVKDAGFGDDIWIVSEAQNGVMQPRYLNVRVGAEEKIAS